MEPLAGVMLSQPALAEALKLRAGPAAVALMVCGSGAAPPACPLNVRLAGATLRTAGAGGDVTTSVTGMDFAGAAGELMLTLLLLVPGTIPAEFTPTAIMAGVDALEGVTVNQPAFGEAVKLRGPAVLVTFND